MGLWLVTSLRNGAALWSSGWLYYLINYVILLKNRSHFVIVGHFNCRKASKSNSYIQILFASSFSLISSQWEVLTKALSDEKIIRLKPGKMKLILDGTDHNYWDAANHWTYLSKCFKGSFRRNWSEFDIIALHRQLCHLTYNICCEYSHFKSTTILTYRITHLLLRLGGDEFNRKSKILIWIICAWDCVTRLLSIDICGNARRNWMTSEPAGTLCSGK